jgi:aspartokinase
MRTVGTALTAIINSSPELQFGFYGGLFNLTQLARFIRPMVEARTAKEVAEQSLVMALSRMARTSRQAGSREAFGVKRFEVENVSVRSGLSTLTLHRSPDTHRATQSIYSKLNKKESYFTLSEGTSEITVIFERRELATVIAALPSGERPKLRRDNIAALGVRFHSRYIEIPGLLQRILQQISLQGINIAELASTATELVVYIAEDDVRRGLDTLLRAFVDRGKNHQSPL